MHSQQYALPLKPVETSQKHVVEVFNRSDDSATAIKERLRQLADRQALRLNYDRDKSFVSVKPSANRVSLVVGTIVLLSSLLGDRLGDIRPFLAGILTGLPVLGLAKHMPAKTRAGAAVYQHILGFQEFLNRAEKDQLERMKDQNLFSKFFPYALALNVADNWAKAFEGIYQEPPDWYVSPAGMGRFNPVNFNRSFHSAVSDMSTAVYSAPRGSGAGSSGSFGGGSSGGGFGGGGGGSW